MVNTKFYADSNRFTSTVIISIVIALAFGMLMMLWHGSYEKNANGKINYNTHVIEPNSNY